MNTGTTLDACASTGARPPVDDPLARRVADLFATDPQFHAARPIPEVVAAVSNPDQSLSALVVTVLTVYADRPALGARAEELVTDPGTGRTSVRLSRRFETTSYGELHERASAIAADWHHHPVTPLRPGDRVAFLGFTSPDYATVDIAALLLGTVAVPLQAGLVHERLAPIIDETEPRLIASSVEQLHLAVRCVLGGSTVRRLVVFDHHPGVDDEDELVEAARTRLAEAGSDVVLETLAEVQARGRSLPPAPVHHGERDRPALLVYTSGSTGAPKGAVYTDRLAAGLYRGYFPRDPTLPLLGFAYLPMSHVAGRSVLGACLAAGGTTYFTARGDLSTLFEDIALTRPTEMVMVPRLPDMLFQRFATEVERRAPTAEQRAEVEAQVHAELRENVLGGRLLRVVTGSAPMTEDRTAFLDACLGLPSHEGFGTTESGMLLMHHRICRPQVLDHKLVDVPELGYLTTDKPHPRGELLVRTTSQVPGYYRRPEVDELVFDHDGFHRTGDVMARTGPDEYRFLDRRMNVLKLAQGEFVAVARLDTAYLASPLIRQAFVHGDSTRSYLLAVVVPTEDAIARAAGDAATLRTLLHEALRRVAAEAGLAPYEIPREIIVETEPFSTANGLLSDINKLLRPRLAERYGQRLEQLYRELATRERGAAVALRAGCTTLDTVLEAARAVLGKADPVPAEARFVDLGGDSLSAVSFAALLKEVFAVDVPVGVVVSPACDLRAVAAHVDSARGAVGTRPSYATVHGLDRTRIIAADLTLDKFLPADVLDAAAGVPRPSGVPRTVLLTGANGFLGRFLCLEWLRRLAPVGGRVVCVVRGADAAAARDRLTAAFNSGDEDLRREFDHVAGHVEVLPGDIAQPRLGLSQQVWARLAAEVDLVVHAAAFVNHVLPYEELLGPNVVGTAELIRLALTTRLKPISYVSSVGVLRAEETSTENADIREAIPQRDLDGAYAEGYAAGKWASEVLLREANDLCGLPVAVFRSDLVMAHRRYTGQLNLQDVFTRLVHSVLVTGLAPRSFYRGPATHAHHDGLPVDYTAVAMVALTERATDGYHTYNVRNPHDDGVSLDVIVDWLAADGHAITRVDDYRDWYRRMTSALCNLPMEQRGHTLLPLLHRYAEPADPDAGRGLPTDMFEEGIRAEGPFEGIPHVTVELIRKYASDLKALRST